ncbi:hypothetical protein BJ138DRAFT_1128520 [Hygrophoropsis aurantiaca]|uniref:Uncharacterized protein n=1 Tax=Hygrophoropsis aurantiaca TaxID=72124 RepID=A0ACB8A557_9AGAM|nr:hypothetical protein BJ138DRAFT_1128520 [Hygrophoropsis aurantiaca]
MLSTSMTALPRVPQFPSPVSADWTAAYTRCLDSEASASGSSGVQSWVLGYLLLQAPTQSGRNSLSREINSCLDHEKLHELCMLYINHFVRAFKAGTKSPTASPSYHPSEEPTNHLNAKSKALRRDRYRCALSGSFDWTSVTTIGSVQQEYVNLPSPKPGSVPTQAAHIFPQSTNRGISGGDKHMYAAGVWAVLEHFCRSSMLDRLDGDNIHRLENIITMPQHLHTLFDGLDIWLEEDQNIANHYQVCALNREFLPAGFPTDVTFTTPDPEKLPLPSPDLLLLHAICARVARLSGAGQYVGTVLRDLEDTTVLSPGGESAQLLFHALAPLDTVGY